MDSPEERLLRLIKGKRKKDTKEALPPAESRPGKKLIVEGIIKKIFIKNKLLKSSFLMPVNRILIAALIILFGYFVYSIIFATQKDAGSAAGERDAAPSAKDALSAEKPVPPEPKDYSDYSKAIGKKLLFAPPLPEKPKGKELPALDIAMRFILVGIIAGDEPQAIIEDTETKKTHYLYAAQSFNGITVKKIDKRKVVLTHEGEEIILVL